ncbi:MAG: glycosyl transferase [Desulfofustis sp.]|nr:glycosyl transferase [Desulfofustis sp.]
MKIAYYCQHVLGVGHFHRSLEVCRALLNNHHVTMVVGGPDVAAHVSGLSLLKLPALQMDTEFSSLIPCEQGVALATIQDQRRMQLLSFVEQFRPDCLIIELFPFGRKAFRFELEPMLDLVRREISTCRVYCSLRDILVEKKTGRDKFEQRAVTTLNRYFDGVLIHSDPSMFVLEQTFGKTELLQVPLHYTGFVSPKPSPANSAKIRRDCGLAPDRRLIVASIGSGSVGGELLDAAAQAFRLLTTHNEWYMQIFTGPYLDEATYERLHNQQNARLKVQRFTDHFIDWLGAADLSVSMAGYNTCMNTLAAGVPALMYPFGQNQEQRLRVEQMPRSGSIRLLENDELAPQKLAALMRNQAYCQRYQSQLKLNGAAETVKIIESEC